MANGKIEFDIDFKIRKENLSALEDALNYIRAEAKSLGDDASDSLKRAGQIAKELETIIGKSFNKDLGSVNVNKFNQELKKSNLTLKDVQSSFVKLGPAGADAYNLIGISILNTNIKLKQSSKLLNDMATTFKNTIRYGISSSIFNTMANSIQRAYDFSKQLNTSLNDIRIVTGQSAEQMDRFATTANNAAKALGATTLDYTKAALIYYQQGLSEEEVQARAGVTVKTANVTGQSASDVSEQLTAVWNGYKVTADETELYIDKLAKVAAGTAADLEELSTGMSKVASAASNAGVDIDTLNGLLATAVSVTRESPETIGTSLRTLFARMGDLKLGKTDEDGVGLGKVSSQLHALGVEVLDQKGNMRDMGDIIKDLAAKWQDLTKAQQQAAAVAIGGKMQYSRLIAIMDNWDMVTNAIQMSEGAIGSLQDQQDIYMDSTQAKLNKLQSTWEDFYMSLINDNEVQGGVGVLTNIVASFDNFVDAFGGGGKAIAAFGTLVANVFNRQIGSAIANTVMRYKNLESTAEVLKRQTEAVKTGPLSGGNEALEANYKIQAQYAEKLLESKRAFSDEEIQQLEIERQQVGALEQQVIEQRKLIELKNKAITENQNENTHGVNFNMWGGTNLPHTLIETTNGVETSVTSTATEDIEDIIREYNDFKFYSNDFINDIKAFSSEWKTFLNENADKDLIFTPELIQNSERFQEIIKDIEHDLSVNLDNDYKWIDMGNEIDNYKARYKEIIKYIEDSKDKNLSVKQVVTEIQNKLNGIKENHEDINEDIEHQKDNLRDLNKEYQKEEELRNERDVKKGIHEEKLNNGAQKQNIMQEVSQVTSAISTITVAWSSVKMLMETWSDDTLSFGDKIIQTITSITMLIPSIISSLTTLNETFDIAKTYKEAYNAAIEAGTVAQEANIAVTEGETVVEETGAASKALSTAASEGKTAATIAETGAEIANNAATTSNTTQEVANTAAKGAATGATWSLAAANEALNAVLAANPIIAVMMVLVALVGTIAAVTSAIDKNTESIVKNNEETIKDSKEKVKEIDQNQKLCQSYLDVAEAYKRAEATKKELEDAGQKVLDELQDEDLRIIALTGNYEKLTKAIKDKNKAAAIEKFAEYSSQKSAAYDSFVQTLGNNNKSAGWFQGGDWFQLDQTSTWGGYEQGQAVKSFYQYLKDNGITIKETQKMSGYTYYMINQAQLMQAEQLAEKWAQSASSDIKGTEFYEKVTEKFIGSTKDYVKEYYEASQEALMQQIEANAPSEVPEDIKAFWKETFDKIKNSDAYVTLSESEQRALTDDILKNLYSDNTEISNFIKRREYLQGFENAGADQGQLDRLEEIINALESVDNLPKLLSGQDFKEFLDNYEYYYELAQKITQLANLEETDTIIERSLELLQKNKDLTDKEKEELASLRNNLEDKYNLLADITDKNSHEYLKALREIRETNEKVEKEALIGIRDQKQDLVEGIVKRLEAYDPNDNTKYIDIEADLSKYEKAMEELKKADYEVKVKIQADFDSDTINDMDLAREFDSLRNLIKSDLKYTYDEAQKIAAEGNGALFLNAKKTAEGTIEVDKEVARNFVKNKQIQLDADKEAAIDQMKTQKEKLIAQEEILTNEIEQLEIALNAKDGVTAQSALNTVKQYEKEYKAKVTELNNALDANAKAAEEEKKIDQDLYEQLGGMYDQNTANYKSSQEEATIINAENITRRVKNIRAEYDAFVATGAANVESESGYVETPFPDSDISGKGGAGGTDPRHKHKQTQKHKSITYDTYGTENVTHVEEAFDPDGILAKYFTKTEDGQWVLTNDEAEQQLYRQTLEKQINALKKERENNRNSQGIIDMRIAALQDAKASLDKHLAGLGSGSGSGSGSTSEKENKDELDIYHQINTELDIIANNLADISKQKEKAFGAEKIKLLNKEISELNKQIDANKRKLAIMKEEAFGNAEKGTEGLQQKLSKYGVTFNNTTGQVTNYDEIWNTRHQILLDEYNTYNAMSSDAQKDYEEKIKAVEDEWEQFKEDIDRYDTIVSKEMHEVQSNIDDEMRQQIADNIEKFSMELTIRLDMQEAIKNWDKFKRDVIDDWDEIWKSNTFSKGFFDENGNWQTNLKRTAQEDLDLLNSYFYKNYESAANPGSMLQGSGVVGTQITKLAELRGEVEKAFNGQNGLFGENQYIETQTALDNLKEYKENAINTATEIKNLIDSIKGAYLGALQEATEEFSEQVDLLERAGKYIEHDMKLIKLIYGDNQYKSLSEHYEKQHENNLQQLDFQTKQRDFWKEQMDIAEENSDEWEYAKEQWLSAIDSANAALEQAVETAKEKWENAIDEVFERLDRKFTDGLGLDYIKEEWSLINKNSDEYLDAINSAYGIQKLQNKYLDAIDKSTDVNNQRRLNELMNSEVNYLQQIDRLTQTDLERAELKFQIALKQMELEDAQNNKTTMRLRRDSQGNYSYQFVANNDEIDKAKEELDELNNKLYTFDLKAYRQNLDKAASAYEEFMQEMAEAAKIVNEEDRIAKETLLKEQYYEYIGMLQDENARFSTNLIESATLEHGELYQQEALDFKNMTDQEIDAFMNNLVPQWKSGVQDMMDQWSGPDGFKESVEAAVDELMKKDQEYRDDLDKIQKTAGVVFDDIKKAANDTILNALNPFIQANDDIIDRYEKQVDYIVKELIPVLKDLQDEYKALIDEINEANRLQGIESEKAANDASESSRPNPQLDDVDSDRNPSPVWEDEDSGGGRGSTQSSGGNGQIDIGDSVTYTGGPYYETSYGEGKHGTRGPGKLVKVTGIASGRPYPIHVKSSDSAYGWLREDQLTGYDTGGYTGSWGDNGRLAVLHQKELVLNAQDTNNFLNALDIMRNIVNNIGSEAFSRLASLGGNCIGDPAFAGI